MDRYNLTIERIKKIEWLNKIGEAYDNDGNIVMLDNYEEAKANLSSSVWEDYVLERSGRLSASLAKDYKAEYREWNKLVKDIKVRCVPFVEEKLDEIESLEAEIKADILFNIVTIALSEYYKELFEDEFWTDLLAVYESGHLACGFDKDKNALIIY